ncbi:MAG TPA: PP2C family protein-serine/threonine phosphatase, partial [Streptosporangiaceae bacterium]|nr:PP2C family protein-serine/threonine phosphatase [Streptosporangiaceae bacterium]
GRGKQPHGRRDPWPGLWHVLCAAPLVAVVVVFCIGRAAREQLFLEPLLAVPPALAGIGTTQARRPLIYGGISLLAAIAVATQTYGVTPSLPIATVIAVAAVTAVSAAGAVLSSRRNQELAKVTTVAEVAQRALLRPLPSRVGPLELGVVYLAATAEARVGGDLYEVARTPYGIRLIMGDVRGKGLGAVEIAADILGVFREAAHDVYTLAEVARRLDASLARREGTPEEFVTAVLVEIDPDVTGLTVYNCGHPPPILLKTAKPGNGRRSMIIVEVAVPAPPLGLMSLGDCSGAGRKMPFNPGDELLLYTDGVTEARDSRRQFYPLTQRLASLADRAAAGPDEPADLLERLRDDVLRHVGAPLDDDAAILHVRAVGAPASITQAPDRQVAASRAASRS